MLVLSFTKDRAMTFQGLHMCLIACNGKVEVKVTLTGFEGPEVE